MAVTASDHRDGGVPSLWSGAVDDMCSGVLDGAQKLMFISAGNMRYEITQPDYVYHEWNVTRGGVEGSRASVERPNGWRSHGTRGTGRERFEGVLPCSRYRRSVPYKPDLA